MRVDVLSVELRHSSVAPSEVSNKSAPLSVRSNVSGNYHADPKVSPQGQCATNGENKSMPLLTSIQDNLFHGTLNRTAPPFSQKLIHRPAIPSPHPLPFPQQPQISQSPNPKNAYTSDTTCDCNPHLSRYRTRIRSQGIALQLL